MVSPEIVIPAIVPTIPVALRPSQSPPVILVSNSRLPALPVPEKPKLKMSPLTIVGPVIPGIAPSVRDCKLNCVTAHRPIPLIMKEMGKTEIPEDIAKLARKVGK